MKRVFFLVGTAACLIACNNSSQTGSGKDSASATSSGGGNSGADSSGSSVVTSGADSVIRCYVYAANQDTIRMKLIQTGQKITGDLYYGLGEKDANTGTINGMMRGDTLVADYSYKSEGKVSIRQEVMLRQGDGFIIGSGATRNEGGKQVFSDLGKMNYGKLRLALTDCGR